MWWLSRYDGPIPIYELLQWWATELKWNLWTLTPKMEEIIKYRVWWGWTEEEEEEEEGKGGRG